jgi:hypothetical protein
MTWVFLIITIGPLDQDYAMIPFRDAMTCGNALPVIHEVIAQEYPDSMARCVVSDIPRVRPQARPEARIEGVAL